MVLLPAIRSMSVSCGEEWSAVITPLRVNVSNAGSLPPVRAFRTLMLLIGNMRRRVLSALPRTVPEMRIMCRMVPRKDTGGERRLPNPNIKQAKSSIPGGNNPPSSATFHSFCQECSGSGESPTPWFIGGSGIFLTFLTVSCATWIFSSFCALFPLLPVYIGITLGSGTGITLREQEYPENTCPERAPPWGYTLGS